MIARRLMEGHSDRARPPRPRWKRSSRLPAATLELLLATVVAGLLMWMSWAEQKWTASFMQSGLGWQRDALNLAIETGDEVRIRGLLKREIDINAPDCDGLTPLLRAEQRLSVEITRLLLDHGADANGNCPCAGTPLGVAAARKSELVELLLEHGADPNRGSGPLKTLPLRLACLPADVRGLQLLIAAGAEVNAVDQTGESALQTAVLLGRVEAVRVLLQAGADVRVVDPAGNTLLHLEAAAMVSDADGVEMIKLLLAHGAPNGTRNRQGLTPLTLAQQLKRPRAAQALAAEKLAGEPPDLP